MVRSPVRAVAASTEVPASGSERNTVRASVLEGASNLHRHVVDPVSVPGYCHLSITIRADPV